MSIIKEFQQDLSSKTPTVLPNTVGYEIKSLPPMQKCKIGEKLSFTASYCGSINGSDDIIACPSGKNCIMNRVTQTGVCVPDLFEAICNKQDLTSITPKNGEIMDSAFVCSSGVISEPSSMTRVLKCTTHGKVEKSISRDGKCGAEAGEQACNIGEYCSKSGECKKFDEIITEANLDNPEAQYIYTCLAQITEKATCDNVLSEVDGTQYCGVHSDNLKWEVLST